MAVNKQLHTRQLKGHVLKSTENFAAVRVANEPVAYTSHLTCRGYYERHKDAIKIGKSGH